MSVAFDAISSAIVQNNAGTTLTWTHTPVASPPSAVGVVLNFYNDASMTVTGITYGGQALTKLAAATSPTESGGGASHHTEIWGSDGLTLASGAQSVVVTASATGNYIIAAATTVTGSNTTTCFSNGAGAGNAANATPTITCTSATGELVIDIAANAPSVSAPTNSGTQTSRWSQDIGGFFSASGSTQAGAATVTSTWAQTTADWVMSAGSFKAAAGGGGAKLKRNAAMDGLAASGPFFSNPLARRMLGWRKGLLIPVFA